MSWCCTIDRLHSPTEAFLHFSKRKQINQILTSYVSHYKLYRMIHFRGQYSWIINWEEVSKNWTSNFHTRCCVYDCNVRIYVGKNFCRSSAVICTTCSQAAMCTFYVSGKWTNISLESQLLLSVKTTNFPIK